MSEDNQELTDEQSPDEREGVWSKECENCGGRAVEQLWFNPEAQQWELTGWRCKSCWRFYFVDGGYCY